MLTVNEFRIRNHLLGFRMPIAAHEIVVHEAFGGLTPIIENLWCIRHCSGFRDLAVNLESYYPGDYNLKLGKGAVI